MTEDPQAAVPLEGVRLPTHYIPFQEADPPEAEDAVDYTDQGDLVGDEDTDEPTE